ncbi:MAG: type 4a pilus biogenesis protein PilO [Nitrospiria bacterium]
MRELAVRYKMPFILFAMWVGVAYLYILRVEEVKALNLQRAALQKEISAMPEPPSPRSLESRGVRFSWPDSVPEFLRDLTRWSREKSLVVVSIEPGDPTIKEDYTEQPVTLEVQGPYRSIGNYLGFLESLPRPLQVTGFRISRVASPSPKVSSDLLARLKLTLYIREGA